MGCRSPLNAQSLSSRPWHAILSNARRPDPISSLFPVCFQILGDTHSHRHGAGGVVGGREGERIVVS